MLAHPSIDDAVAALYPLDVHPIYISGQKDFCSCTSFSPCPAESSQPSPLPASQLSSPPGPPSSSSSTIDDDDKTASTLTSSADGDSSSSISPSGRRLWAPDEETRFLQALHQHVSLKHRTGLLDMSTGKLRVGLGRGVARKIAQAVGTRSKAQVRSHAQKVFQHASKAGKSPWEM